VRRGRADERSELERLQKRKPPTSRALNAAGTRFRSARPATRLFCPDYAEPELAAEPPWRRTVRPTNQGASTHPDGQYRNRRLGRMIEGPSVQASPAARRVAPCSPG